MKEKTLVEELSDEAAITRETTESSSDTVESSLIPNSSTSYVLVNGETAFPTITIGGTGEILVGHYISSLGFITSTNLQRNSRPVYTLQPGWHDVAPGTYEHRIIASVTGIPGSTRGAYSQIRYKRG